MQQYIVRHLRTAPSYWSSIMWMLLCLLLASVAMTIFLSIQPRNMALPKNILVENAPKNINADTIKAAQSVEQNLRNTLNKQQQSMFEIAGVLRQNMTNKTLNRAQFVDNVRYLLKRHASVDAMSLFVPTLDAQYAAREGRMFSETIPGYVKDMRKIYFPVRHRLATERGNADLLSGMLSSSPLTAATLYNAIINPNKVVMSPIIAGNMQEATVWLMQSFTDNAGNPIGVVGMQINVARWHEQESLPANIGVRISNIEAEQVEKSTVLLEKKPVSNNITKSMVMGIEPAFLLVNIIANDASSLIQVPIKEETGLNNTPLVTASIFSGILGLAMMGAFAWQQHELKKRQQKKIKYLIDAIPTKSAIEQVNLRTDQVQAFKKLLQVSDVIPWIAELKNHTYVYIGPQVSEKIGYPLSVWQSNGFLLRHVFPDDRVVFNAMLQRASKQEEALMYEYRVRRPDGAIRWMRGSCAVLQPEDSPLMYGFMTDITDQKNAQETLKLACDAAERANRTKSEFLATMSHELRTPLNAIIGFSEIMHQEILGALGNDKYKEYIYNIYASGKHLLSLINDLLDLSKIEAGYLELQEEEVLMSDLMQSCYALVAERAKRSGINLQLDVPLETVMLFVDGRRLKQIIINLLGNAVKFTDSGGKITLSGRVHAKGIDLSVQDTGIGMKPDQIPRALEKFRQTESGAARAHEGTGLGLPIAKSLAELHGGSLSIKSVYGEGTVVTIFLPNQRMRFVEKYA